MKVKVSGIMTLASFVAAAIVAAAPQLVQASESQTKTVTTTSTTAESVEISSLKRQLADCNKHKMNRKHRRHYACVRPKQTAQVIEKTTIIEKPVVIEKVIEKQVYVDRPAEKQVVVEQAAVIEKAVVVEHSKHRKHLLHFGIPFVGVTLF